MYESVFLNATEKKIQKLDNSQRKKVVKKIKNICLNPNKNYKSFKHNLQGSQRVHIGHFVLVFIIDHENKTIYFDDYEHHDNVCK